MMTHSAHSISRVAVRIARVSCGLSLLFAGLVGCSAELEGDESDVAMEGLVDGVASLRAGDGVLGIATPKGGGAVSNACTGSLVSDRVVLTAAHCVIDAATNQPKAVLVYDGTSLQAMKWSANVGATAIKAFPGYDVKAKPSAAAIDTWQDDIAVIVLPQPAPASIRRLPLAAAGEMAGYAVGSTVRLTGYGSTGPNAQDAYVKRTGAGTISEARTRTVTLSKTATTASGCGGDSGGPIQARDATGRVLGVATFVSTTEATATCRDKTHYMRVSAYRPFIDAAIASSGGGAPSKGSNPAPAPTGGPSGGGAPTCENGTRSSHQCTNGVCTCSIGGTRADGRVVTRGQRCSSDEACETECEVCR